MGEGRAERSLRTWGMSASRKGGQRGLKLILPAIIVVIGVGLSFTTLEYTTRLNSDAQRDRFEHHTQDTVDHVDQRIDRYSEVLFSVSGLFEMPGPVQRDDFHDFVEGDGILARLPGVKAVEFARYVPREDKEAFEADVRSDTSLEPSGYPDFSIWPEGDRQEYYVVDYIEPFDGDEDAFGFDLGTDQSMLHAIELSGGTGVPAATSAFPIMSQKDEHKGVMLLLVIYQSGLPTDTASQRRAAFLGSVNMVLCVHDMMEGVMSPELEGFDLEIYDAGPSSDEPQPLTEDGLMFDSDGVVRSPVESHQDESPKDVYLYVGGQRWALRFTPNPPAGSFLEEGLPLVIFAFGSAMSVVVAGILFVLGESTAASSNQARVTRAILESIGEGVVVADEEGRLTHFNPAAERLYGKGPTEVPASDWSKAYGIYLPDKTTPFPAEDLPLARALKGNTVDDVEEFVRSAGSPEGVVVTVTSRPILDDAGSVRGAVSVSHDITERKRAECELKHSEELLAVRNRISEIFLTTPDEAVYEKVLECVLDATNSEHGVFRYIDEKGALVMASWSREAWSLCQVPDKEMIIPHDSWSGPWGRVLMEKRALSANGGFNVPEGHIPISRVLVEPIRHGDDIIGFLAVGNKASDYDDMDMEIMETIGSHMAPVLNARLQRDREERMRKLAEEARARYSQELERSNADLQQFAYVASHDLQEPLRMVASYVQLLGRRYKGKLDSDAIEFIEYAADGAKRMQQLIRDLLTYSRVSGEGREFEPTDCEEVLEDVLKNLEVLRQESGAEVTHDALPTLEADRGQLVQLFQNLVGNAIKFRGKEPPRIHFSAENGGEEWVFSVRDNGIGIQPEYADRVFVIFQRLHDRTEYPGTGIGLAVCKKIVERHNGRIWVESEPGEGSTFYFTLPVDGGAQT